mmetsp:Transcript_32355/g.54541  ORF Transcript_32355/g.54541 Transcript_32355/m.54541 type:complete len:832 (+) Transcript_32355:47-2542(+)
MDIGICPGNYHDYADDEVAIQREFEIGDALEGGHFRDEDFPANARSLYFDPLNPPKGAIPNESLRWLRICEGDISLCDFPEFFKGDHVSCRINQGSLGDKYFVNALRLLSCQPQYVNRLLVSNKYAAQGLYTLKFHKAGKWRYVHVDDRIPSRQSGNVNFARNHNPNETFAMLLEKAYAKLHGCYEAVANGLIEKTLHELTCSAAVQSLRLETLSSRAVCDEIWDQLEKAIGEGKLIGCGRFIPDPYAENPAKRQGLVLGTMYQVMDVCISSAEPTADLDAITVGMVCVRNLQGPNGGRYTGRWSYGHKLWSSYKEIALDLRHRTREIQYKRGLGKNPNDGSEANFDDRVGLKNSSADTGGEEDLVDDADFNPDDENDELDIDQAEKRQAVKLIQPLADDLYWIQIEDFVDVFNRVYICTDYSFEKHGETKRFVSRWVPGDFIAGSGGPPIMIATQTAAPAESAEGDAKAAAAGEDSRPETAETGASSANGGEREKQPLEGEPEVIDRYPYINENFTDNPMYPFSVSEPTTIGVTLFQRDLRWNIGRLGDDSLQVVTKSFVQRRDRLQACMEYSEAIGFLVVRLSGLKMRLTEFRLKKIVNTSDVVGFSNTASNAIPLIPGRYAVIPYTHRPLSRAQEYILHFNYMSSQVEFEIEDVIEQRLVDDAPSDQDEDEDLQPDDNDLLKLHEDDDEVSIMSFERVRVHDEDDDGFDMEEEDSVGEDVDDLSSAAMRIRAAKLQPRKPPPRKLLYKPWEYVEDTEELGVQQVFGEVGDIMKYVKTLRGEVRKLHSTIRALHTVRANQAAANLNNSNANDHTTTTAAAACTTTTTNV